MFIGISVAANDDIRELLGFLGELSCTKVVEERNLHINLRFLGDVDEEGLALCSGALRNLGGFGRFKVSLNGTGAFPSEEYIRVVWVDVESNELMDLESKLGGELVKRGFKSRKRDYKPHVTVARVKSKPGARMREVLEGKFDKHYIDINVESVELMESKLTPEGPVYEIIESVML